MINLFVMFKKKYALWVVKKIIGFMQNGHFEASFKFASIFVCFLCKIFFAFFDSFAKTLHV